MLIIIEMANIVNLLLVVVVVVLYEVRRTSLRPGITMSCASIQAKTSPLNLSRPKRDKTSY